MIMSSHNGAAQGLRANQLATKVSGNLSHKSSNESTLHFMDIVNLTTPPFDPAAEYIPVSDDLHLTTDSQMSPAFSTAPESAGTPIKDSNATLAKDILEMYAEDSSCGSNYLYGTVEPRAPVDNSLISVNLESVPYLALSGSGGRDFSSTTSMIGMEAEAVQALELELDPTITDKFRPRPLLHDPALPFIAASPVFPSVDELLQQLYPQIMKGTMPYYTHRERLMRNRRKLEWLRDALLKHELKRRELLNIESSSIPRTRRSFR